MLGRLALCVLVACAVAGVAASSPRPAVIIHAVGDSATAGDMTTVGGDGSRYSAHLSYRRYLYHMLTTRGYNVRFVGSKSDCAVDGLDFDSHHDGYAKGRVSDIKSGLNAGRAALAESVNNAVTSLTSEGANKITLVRIVSAGYEDAVGGRASKDLSDQDVRSLVDLVDGLIGDARISDKHTLVVPSPPPGGVRVKNDKLTELERDFKRDSRYEDYRFFLTWRGHFYEKRKIAADCFSYFDFLQHYSPDGSRLNALGDAALARCVFDNLVVRKYLPRVTEAPAAALECDSSTADAVSRKLPKDLPPYATATEGDVHEPALVNRGLPPLTTLTARAVRTDAPAKHATCTATDAPAKAGKCAKTPDFPEYEMFESTEKQLP